jgi:hypothetical protein
MLRQLIYWLLATFLFWFLFANLMRLRDRLMTLEGWKRTAARIAGYALLLVGYPYDVLYNLTYGSAMFWQLPRRWEWTFTARLQRLVFSSGWRGAEARFICRYLVEPWDESHCGEYP